MVTDWAIGRVVQNLLPEPSQIAHQVLLLQWHTQDFTLGGADITLDNVQRDFFLFPQEYFGLRINTVYLIMISVAYFSSQMSV